MIDSKTKKRPIIIWRFIDGKAGHEKQSLGLVNAISSLTETEYFDIKVVQSKSKFINLLCGKHYSGINLKKPDLLIGVFLRHI